MVLVHGLAHGAFFFLGCPSLNGLVATSSLKGGRGGKKEGDDGGDRWQRPWMRRAVRGGGRAAATPRGGLEPRGGAKGQG
jgi:hypothetical protein